LGDFNRGTRQSILKMPVQSYPGTAGQITTQVLPQTGYLAGVYLLLKGTTTTAAASSTTVATYPVLPEAFIRRIRIYNNQGVELWNTSGYGAYLYQRTLRSSFDPAVDGFDFTFGGGLNPFNRYHALPTSLGASATETWKAGFWLPIAWGASLQAGLQLAQDPAITYSLEITWGDVTDLYSATTGTVTLSAVTVQPMVELYHVPPQGYDLPRLSFTKTVLEEIVPLTTGTGDNTVKFVTGNMLTRHIQEFSNAPGGVRAAIAPATAAAADLITALRVRYSQTQIPYDQDAATMLFRQRLLYGLDFPAGVYIHELSDAMGLPELVSTRDILNTARLTDLDFVTTLSAVTLATGQVRVIKEQLVANR
jgi:hypothetical protein